MFSLSLHGEESSQALLKSGYSYCLIVRSDAQRKAVLDVLASQSNSAVVANDGGLISNLRVWENLALPVQYRNIQLGGRFEENVVDLLEKCGFSDERSFTELMFKLPDQLSLYEKRLVGFVRAMLMVPEMMVYDSLHEGLSPREMTKTAMFDHIFRLYYPFRTSVLLSFDEYRDPIELRQIVIRL